MDSALPVESMQRQIVLMQQHMKENMKEGEHFGKIPGCGDKPSLLKSGAEKLCFIFQLAPRFEVTERELPREHREVSVKCLLHSRITGAFFGEGLGCCSTMETKYRYRNSDRLCPQCQKPTIIKGREEYGGGWICFARKGGCGAKFGEKDEVITGQVAGRVEHDNPADYYNTVLKIAKKRAQVDATLTVTAASDIFTQDVEDFPDAIRAEPIPPRPKENLNHGGVRRAVQPDEVAQPPAPEDVPVAVEGNPWGYRLEGVEREGQKFQYSGRQLFEMQIAILEKLLKPANANKITLTDRHYIDAALKARDGRNAAAEDYLKELDKEDIGDLVKPPVNV